MSYSARFFQNQWDYNPNGDDFNARVGRLLAGGQDLQASMKQKALQTLTGNLQFEKEQKEHHRVSDDASRLINQTSGSGRREPDTTGYVWVDPKGTYMGELPQPEQPDYVQKAGTTLSHSQQFYTKMQPVERSMYMWRRINAGCVESTTRWPNPTYKDHFPHDLSNAEKPDKRHHLKKTDFTDFTECKIKQGHAGADR